MSRLDRDEQDILDAFEAGRLKRVKNAKQEIAAHRAAAEATFRKDARINIRLSSKDLRAFRLEPSRKAFPTRRWWRASCTSSSTASCWTSQRSVDRSRRRPAYRPRSSGLLAAIVSGHDDDARPCPSGRDSPRVGARPAGLTVTEAAERLGVSRKTLHKILAGAGGVTADMALRLEEVFGKPDARIGFGCRQLGIFG